jgi:hypothetical protein
MSLKVGRHPVVLAFAQLNPRGFSAALGHPLTRFPIGPSHYRPRQKLYLYCRITVRGCSVATCGITPVLLYCA